MKIRIIHTASSDGSLIKEEVTFTEDFEMDAQDVLIFGMMVVSDSIHDIDFPDSFPTNDTFKKVF